MAQVTIHVPPRPYQARIENGLLARAGTLLGGIAASGQQSLCRNRPAGAPSLGCES